MTKKMGGSEEWKNDSEILQKGLEDRGMVVEEFHRNLLVKLFLKPLPITLGLVSEVKFSNR